MSDRASDIRVRGGYHFTVLKIDLATGEIERVAIGEQFALEHIGGPGLQVLVGGAFLPRQAGAALDTGNTLVLAPGPLTGLALPGSSRCHIMALLPDTGLVVGGSIGGALGPAIRRAGYDAVVIAGRAAALSYLTIDEDRVEIVAAPRIAGMSARAASDTIRGELGRDHVATAAIGPAGEREVSVAIISSGGPSAGSGSPLESEKPPRAEPRGGHHCAGGGLGAVMGGKNLKAIAVSGGKEPPVADPAGLAVIAERLPSEVRCPVDCEAGCRFKWLGPSGRHGGRLGRPSHDPALSPALARAYDELGLDSKGAGGPRRRRRPTPEAMLLDLLGLCYQPWLEMEGGIDLAAECYRAVTGVEWRVEELVKAARAGFPTGS